MHYYYYKLCIIIKVFKTALMVVGASAEYSFGQCKKNTLYTLHYKAVERLFVLARAVRTEATSCVAQRTLISTAKRVCMYCMP